MATVNIGLSLLRNYKSIRLMNADFRFLILDFEKKKFFFDFQFAALQKLPIFAPANNLIFVYKMALWRN